MCKLTLYSVIPSSMCKLTLYSVIPLSNQNNVGKLVAGASHSVESEMCPCNADIMTAEHLLQHCRLHDALRRDMWPEPTLLRDKLYGNLEELRRTVAFVRTTGFSI